jgi:predicted DNA-binding transcriptional regulator YafY
MSPSQAREPAQPKDHEQNIRRLSLVTYLLSRPGQRVSAAQIRMNVEGYPGMTDDAFKRRFSEDRAELREIGICVASETGDDGVDLYSLPGDAYYLPKVEFDSDEITALAACYAVLQDGFAYSQPLRLALLSLTQGRPEFLTETAAPALAVVPEAAEQPSLLPKLQAAVDDRKTIRFTYYTIQRDAETERTVDPYGLQLVAGEWYLIGHCHLRDAVRTFRLSRIHSRVVHATRKPHDFTRPTGFDLEAYQDRPAWRLGPVHGTARVRVSASMAWWVEAHWAHCGAVAEGADGSIVFTTEYADTRRLLSWVLGLAEAAELLDPPELRAELRARLSALRTLLASPVPELADSPAPAVTPRPGGRRRKTDDWHVEVDRFTRLSTLASYLLRSCGEDEADVRVADVCAALDVSAKDLREDVRLLNLVGHVGGMVLYAEFAGRGKLHVQCDVEGPTLSRPARLSPLQADALLLAIDLVGGQLPSASRATLDGARQKIRRARDTGPTLGANDLLPGAAGVLDAVNAAIAGRRLLRIEYWKEGTAGLSERVVEPYLVVHERGEWYYICWCRSAGGRRMFRIATTRSARVLDETFAPREDLELDLYRREGIPPSASYAPKTASVWYSREVSRWVEERQPVRRLTDGSCVAEQPYVEEGWLTQHVLPFSDKARVLAPPAAADHLRATVDALLAVYGG